MKLPKKAVILAGGLGTRLAEETHSRPKPMIEIGGKPILWHIMKTFSAADVNEFIICLGYKGYLIKEYFMNYFLHTSDVTFDMKTNAMEVHQNNAEPWKVSLIDTGLNTMTGGRLKRVASYLGDEDFFFTYGDGVANVDLRALAACHYNEKRLVTVTGVQPPGRFGALECDNNQVINFSEKPKGDGSWINGGFFIVSPQVVEYIEDDHTIWEQEPMKNIAANGQMSVYYHQGFWQPMDTLREKNLLEQLWEQDKAPWKVWSEC